MVRSFLFALLLALSPVVAHGQDVPEAPVMQRTSTMFTLFGAEVVADTVTTRILYQRHHPENDPLARPFVQAGIPGQIGAGLLGMGVTGGLWFALHRLHHDCAASWFLRTVTAGEGGNVARQIVILRRSKS